MKKNAQKNEKKSKLRAMIVLIAFTAIMLIISTYAWFSTQRAVTISNLSGTVNVAEGLDISLDANKWTNSLDLSAVSLTEVTTTEKDGTYSTTANHVPSELKPASTIGASGGTGLKLWTGKLVGNKLETITLCDESKTSADDDAYAGYYAFDIFLRNSSSSEEAQQLYLSKNSTVTVWADDAGGDETTGLQNTVRLALAEYGATADVNATQSEIIAATVTANPTISQVTIWEPNANYHVDFMVTNATRYNFSEPSRDKVLTTYALNDATATELENVYAITGTKLTAQKAIQTEITVPETGEPESYVTTTAVALTDTSTSGTAFALEPNKVSRIRIYLWLEGQDQDCVNYASHGGGITVNFGIEKQ